MSDTSSPTVHPQIHWSENGAEHSARWRSESGMPPPKRVVIADDRTTADQAYRLACEGTAMLWRGDFQNARQLLQALARRADHMNDKPSKKAKAAKLAKPEPSITESFHLHRQAQSQRARTLAMLLLPFDADYTIPLRRAPDVKLACNEAYGRGEEAFVASLRELLGLIGAHEWRRTGVELPIWKDVKVTVSGPFDGGAANPGDVGADGAEVWPAIIEAAYAQQYKAGDTQYSTGVLPGDVMEAVLGAGADTVGAGSIDAAGMSAKLADGEAVVAWTPPFEDANGNSLMTPAQTALINEYGIAGGHAYAVSEIIPAGTSYVDASGTSVVAAEDIVVLDNPWGSSDVMMPYSDYQTVYGHVSSAPTD